MHKKGGKSGKKEKKKKKGGRKTRIFFRNSTGNSAEIKWTAGRKKTRMRKDCKVPEASGAWPHVG